MKNLSLLITTSVFLCLFTLSTTIKAQTNAVKGQGSDTMLPVVKALVDTYSSTDINVEGGGSSLGFRGLSNYACQFAISSRKVKTVEKAEIENKYDQLLEKVIAFDAVSIITHPSNTIKRLTIRNIAKIYSGEITNWKELGGEDVEITVISRDDKSGTYGYFQNKVMNNRLLSDDCIYVESNKEAVMKVSMTEGAIGYCGIAYIDEIVQPISVSANNTNYVYPSFRNALQKTYPLSRPLYLYYRDSEKNIVLRFVKFTLSDKGQQIIAHKGYIPAF